MASTPKWLMPWLVPLFLAAGVIVLTVSLLAGTLLLAALVLGVLPYLRILYLRQHPPDPELRRPNFWGFR
jgi:hypothetical protein